MSQCSWDPNKHGGKPCPVHGAGGNSGSSGHKIRINNGKYEMKLSDDSDWEEISSEEYNDLREGGYQDFDETVDDDFGFDENYDPVEEQKSFIEDNSGYKLTPTEKEENGYYIFKNEKGELVRTNDEGQIIVSEEKSDESKRVKTGIDSQNRAYVQSSDGNRQYFASEKEAKDYADRMNEAQGLNEVINEDEEKSPEEKLMKEKSIRDAVIDDTLKDTDVNKEAIKSLADKEYESEADKKYATYKENGKSTWNQKLNKGDKVTFKDKNGNDMDAYIGGFYFKGDLQDEDTYEEGKDNLWHDFRGLQLVDENGKEVGNINANQIIKHEGKSNTENKEKQENTFSNSKKVRDWVKEYLTKQGLDEDFVQKTLKMMDDNQNVSDYYYELMKKLQGK